ncbi:hypothetical protein L211DRAFT_31191 [Terfezia boudieri ATCC MYA-4762]|uniref:Uncharacterized protein n=1 Tax=Terfezia boudieri ATCC MYA-4762 TaxID=1051890 RepID=A0A3N4MC96_9PEZI|nr:hypothetical protein L211DRAFT_31191 [Terfezia boudieri ATCC MYA-4762]
MSVGVGWRSRVLSLITITCYNVNSTVCWTQCANHQPILILLIPPRPRAHFANVELLSQSMAQQIRRSILKESRTIQSLVGNYLLSLKTKPTCQQTWRIKALTWRLWMMRRKRMEVSMSMEITLLKKRLRNTILIRE